MVGTPRALALVATATLCGAFVALPTAPPHAPRLVAGAVRACDSPPLPQLSGAQRRALRSHAGRLAAAKQLTYVHVSEPSRSAAEVEAQLRNVELVRCKFAVTKKAEAKVCAEALASATGAHVAEVLGHTALLYKPSEKRLVPLDS